MQQRSKDPKRRGQFVGENETKSVPAERKKPTKWDIEARRIVRSEMERRDISYKQLALKLKLLGEDETERNLISRVTRGTFTFGFAIKCLRAMGAAKVTIAPAE